MSKKKRYNKGTTVVTTVPSRYDDNEDHDPTINRLFVYGIFLDEINRDHYGMSNPEYATVKGYATFGNQIVQAVPIDGVANLALTGLTVDVDPAHWNKIDQLEGGYDRELVITTDGEELYMYVAKSGERGAY